SEFMGPSTTSRFVRFVICAACVFAFFALPSLAQTKKRAPQKKSAPTAAAAWTKIDCTQDVEVRLSPARSIQGSLVQAELRSPNPLTDVSGWWDDKPVPFLPETAPAMKTVAVSKTKSAPEDIHRGLVGIDLEKAAGTFDVGVTAKTASGSTITCN